MAHATKLMGALAASALVIASASPVAARGHGGRWHHGHGDGVDAGAVFGILLGVGVIAAIASASARNKDADTRGYDPRDGDRGYDPRYDEQRSDAPGYDDRPSNDPGYDSDHASVSEDEAVDACAIAARDEAAQSGGFAEVNDITGVQSFGSGYDVTGTIDQRSSYRASDRQTRSFRCTFENGQVAGVTFGTAA